MATLQFEHPISGFAIWKAAFDHDCERPVFCRSRVDRVRLRRAPRAAPPAEDETTGFAASLLMPARPIRKIDVEAERLRLRPRCLRQSDRARTSTMPAR